MSNENLGCIIPTATVAIFSPDMKRTLLVFNDRLIAFVPPGGKQKPEDNGNILYTALREVREEVGIDLSTVSGIWLDGAGSTVKKPVVIQEEAFQLEEKKLSDSLFFFRLTGDHGEKYEKEKIGEWYGRDALKDSHRCIEGRIYGMLVPGIRYAILAVMMK